MANANSSIVKSPVVFDPVTKKVSMLNIIQPIKVKSYLLSDGWNLADISVDLAKEGFDPTRHELHQFLSYENSKKCNYRYNAYWTAITNLNADREVNEVTYLSNDGINWVLDSHIKSQILDVLDISESWFQYELEHYGREGEYTSEEYIKRTQLYNRYKSKWLKNEENPNLITVNGKDYHYTLKVKDYDGSPIYITRDSITSGGLINGVDTYASYCWKSFKVIHNEVIETNMGEFDFIHPTKDINGIYRTVKHKGYGFINGSTFYSTRENRVYYVAIFSVSDTNNVPYWYIALSSTDGKTSKLVTSPLVPDIDDTIYGQFLNMYHNWWLEQDAEYKRNNENISAKWVRSIYYNEITGNFIISASNYDPDPDLDWWELTPDGVITKLSPITNYYATITVKSGLTQKDIDDEVQYYSELGLSYPTPFNFDRLQLKMGNAFYNGCYEYMGIDNTKNYFVIQHTTDLSNYIDLVKYPIENFSVSSDNFTYMNSSYQWPVMYYHPFGSLSNNYDKWVRTIYHEGSNGKVVEIIYDASIGKFYYHVSQLSSNSVPRYTKLTPVLNDISINEIKNLDTRFENFTAVFSKDNRMLVVYDDNSDTVGKIYVRDMNDILNLLEED